jgi:hypothetical protein
MKPIDLHFLAVGRPRYFDALSLKVIRLAAHVHHYRCGRSVPSFPSLRADK